MAVNIEKVSQWPRVWRNHFSSEWKGYLLTTENAYSLPVPVLKGKTGGDSLPEGWTGFETDLESIRKYSIRLVMDAYALSVDIETRPDNT